MSTASLETWYAIKHGPLYRLSEQFLTSCDTYNGGCNGGWPTDAYRFVKDEGSILEDDYPYTSNQAPCQSAGKNRLVYTDPDRPYVDVIGEN
jgi:hypothetical protein